MSTVWQYDVKGASEMEEFDGERFAELVILIIVISLLFFGSTEIANFTSGPTPV